MGERIHKTLRLDGELAAAVKALQADGESETATYCRVLLAGVEALRGGAGGQTPDTVGTAQDSTVEALQDHVRTLKEQMTIKDEQIKTITTLADHAQQLHAATATRTLEAADTAQDSTVDGEQRRGFWARLFG